MNYSIPPCINIKKLSKFSNWNLLGISLISCFLIITHARAGEEESFFQEDSEMRSPLMMFGEGSERKQREKERINRNNENDPRCHTPSNAGSGDNPRGALNQQQGIEERGSENLISPRSNEDLYSPEHLVPTYGNSEQTPLLNVLDNRKGAPEHGAPLQEELSHKNLVIEALQKLETEHEIVKVALHCLNRPGRSKHTMALLRCLSVMNDDVTIVSLLVANNGLNFGNHILILNNEETPFVFTVPSDDGSANAITIEAPIIPSEMKSNILKVARSPIRNPSSQENEQVKDYIYEAFEDYFGTDVANDCLDDLMQEAEKQQPLSVNKLQEAFEKLSHFYEDENNPNHVAFKERAQNLGNFLDPFTNNEKKQIQKALVSYNKAKEILSHASQQDLLKTLWYSGETAVRGTGVMGRGFLNDGRGLRGAQLGFYTGIIGTTSVIFRISTWSLSIAGATHAFIGASSLRGFENFRHVNDRTLNISRVVGVIVGSIVAYTFDPALFSDNPSTRMAQLTSSLVGGFIGSIAAGTVMGTFEGVTADDYAYFSPDVAARKAGEAWSDFRNRNTFGPEAIELLNEAHQQHHNFREKLPTLFAQISPVMKEHFLSHLTTELAKSTEETAAANPSPLVLPRTFEEVQSILELHIQERIESLAILINHLKQKMGIPIEMS
jgi:hypothetical protein